MPMENVAQPVICAACSVEVREGALFCYNCGRNIGGQAKSSGKDVPIPHSEQSVHAEADPISEDFPPDDNSNGVIRPGGNLGKAKSPGRSEAERIRRSRIRKAPAQMVWEPGTQRFWPIITITIIVFFTTALIILFAVYLK